jgi:hypothetical protein
MYCSSCGIEVTQELNYCNRCGANLNSAASLVPQLPSPPLKLTGPTIALGATIVMSLVAIFTGIDNLAMKGLSPKAIAAIAIVSLGVIFGIAALFINLWMKLLASSSAAPEQRPAQLKKPQPNAQIPAPNTGPMNAPISSVTDHTTRTFEPVYREQVKGGK